MDENSEPPLKRRKANGSGFSGPDGFNKPKSALKALKVPVPRFQSAFDAPKATTKLMNDTSASTALKTLAPPSDVRARVKPISRPSTSSGAFSHLPALDPQLQPGLERHSKPSDKPRAPSHPMGPNFAADTSHSTSRMEKSKSKTSNPPSKTIPKLKPLIPPSAPPKTPMKPLSIPRLPLTDSPAQKPTPGHKAMPLQLPLQPPEPPAKTLRTIGTTRVARAIDLSTENGFAELAGLFLQDHHSEFGLRNEGEPETMRGLDFSPKKGTWSGKEPRLQKDGLAAQASLIISQTKTSLSLWEKEYNIFFSSRSHLNRPPADARLCVIKIVHQPRKIPTASSAPGLALCRLASSISSPPFPLETVSKTSTPVVLPWNEPSQPVENTPVSPTFFVLFSFNVNPSPSTTPVRNPVDFKEENEFWIWRPWRAVALTSAQLNSLLELSSFGASPEITLGKTITDDSDGARIPAPEGMEHTVLLCDRFVCARG